MLLGLHALLLPVRPARENFVEQSDPQDPSFDHLDQPESPSRIEKLQSSSCLQKDLPHS
jgi:hypothetical protein